MSHVEAGRLDHRVPFRAERGVLRSHPLADADERGRENAHRDEAAQHSQLARLARTARHGEISEEAAHELKTTKEERSPGDQVRALREGVRHRRDQSAAREPEPAPHRVLEGRIRLLGTRCRSALPSDRECFVVGRPLDGVDEGCERRIQHRAKLRDLVRGLVLQMKHVPSVGGANLDLAGARRDPQELVVGAHCARSCHSIYRVGRRTLPDETSTRPSCASIPTRRGTRGSLIPLRSVAIVTPRDELTS